MDQINEYILLIERINNNFKKHGFCVTLFIEKNCVFAKAGLSKSLSVGKINNPSTLSFLRNYLKGCI